jgi:DNA polymerase-3 subunit beta
MITANPVSKTIICAATNLEIAIKATMPAEIVPGPDKDNQVLLPGKQLTDIIRSFPAGKMVEVITNETGAAVKCGKSNFKIPVTPVTEFPDIKEPVGNNFSVSTELFLKAVKQTAYATDSKGERTFTQSILFDIEPGKLTLVATDGNRLAIQSLLIEGGSNIRIMVPVLSLKKIVDIAYGSKIRFCTTNNQLFAVFGDWPESDSYIMIRLMEGQYPQYQQIIPQNLAGQIIIDRCGLIQILERAELVDAQARLQLIPERMKSLSVSNGKEGSQFEEEIEALKQSNSDEFNDGFNLRYLLDFLKSVDSKAIEINYVGSLKPVLLKGEDDTCQYICMPVKLAPAQPVQQAAPVAADIRQAI